MPLEEKLVLKLGGKCNLGCKFCHCVDSSYNYNPDIINYIKDNKIKRLHFCGGEPLLYLDIIQKITDELQLYVNKFFLTTNASLLTMENIFYFNSVNMHVSVSLDEEHANQLSINKLDNNYELLRFINNLGVSTVYSNDHKSIEELRSYVDKIFDKYGVIRSADFITPAFIHQTKDSPNEDTTIDDAKRYIIEYCKLMEIGFINYIKLNKTNIFELGTGYSFIHRFLSHLSYEGYFKCINPHNRTLTLDGRFLLCPYGDTYIGDIYKGIDWKLVESYKPDRCKSCELFDICGSMCIANITDNECYIFRCLYKHYKKLLKKYNIDEEELLSNEQLKIY